MQKKRQIDRLRQHLQKGLPITPLSALSKLGIYRLSARIYDLRREGMAINTGYKRVRSRTGTSTVAIYRLAGRR